MSALVKPQLPKLPEVGSKEYRELDYKQQLEIASLKLFNPDLYLARVGEGGSDPVLSSFPDFSLSYPDNSGVPIPEDLPLSFLKRYWAGYSCSFREKWYTALPGSMGFTPLDKYGIDCGWMVNVRLFNFSIMAIYPAIRTILKWITEVLERDEVTFETLLDSCKIYAYMAMSKPEDWPYRINDAGKPEVDPIEMYFRVIQKYKSIVTFDEMNDEFPLAEPSEELDYIAWEEFSILNKPRYSKGNYFFPLVPSELFTIQKFRISAWDFIDEVNANNS